MKKLLLAIIVVFLLSTVIPSAPAIYNGDVVAFVQSKSVRCHGVTKKGARCKRKTKYKNGYCWQHQDQAR